MRTSNVRNVAQALEQVACTQLIGPRSDRLTLMVKYPDD
jgi:hypothetical protein